MFSFCTYPVTTYMEQEGNKHLYMKQEYLSTIFNQKLQQL